MTLRAFSSYGFEVNGKLTLRVAITRVKCFAITGAALDQMARPTLGACNCCFVRFIDKFGMFAFRVVNATNKHTKASPGVIPDLRHMQGKPAPPEL